MLKLALQAQLALRDELFVVYRPQVHRLLLHHLLLLNHVLLHQTVIGQEAKAQLDKIGEYPDMVFAPCGGGSNFGGLAFPFFADKAAGKQVRAHRFWRSDDQSPR